jgi:two-component system phosphate regulon sensor histidine kinase PhoR
VSIEALLAAAGSAALGWWLGNRNGRPRALLMPERPDRQQLLRWIDGCSLNGWLLIDDQDRVLLLNPRAERLLQVPGAGLLRQQPLSRLCDAEPLRELVREARVLQRPQRLVWALGEDELELQALPGAEGCVAVVLQSRRSLEAQLEQQERWVSDVAHELKTPLTALLLVGDSLAAQVNSGNAVLVERLQRELRRLQELVSDLLELSRLENTVPGSGQRQVLVDLGVLVEQVWAGLQPLAELRGIGLDLVGPSPTADAVPRRAQVMGDPSRLHRALLNLLENALRYSPDRSAVRVRLLVGEEWCLLSVRDRGQGLSDTDLERMFERFYRGDPSRVRQTRGGTGLGLAIVQQIALTHGGRVQARNHPEGGAQLELLLPVGS